MTINDLLVKGMVWKHNIFKRADITRNARLYDVTQVGEESSTPHFPPTPSIITGMFWRVIDGHTDEVWGGMVEGQATLGVLPGVTVDYMDEIIVDGRKYRIDMLHPMKTHDGTHHLTHCKLQYMGDV